MTEDEQPPRSATYIETVRAHVPRVLSLLDREEVSPTRGCMDRTWWAWKFTDFPAARFQEGLCYLSWLWATDLPGNPLYRSERALGWIASGFDWWASIQYRDGSFDEAYPFERSLAATAFSSFYLAEAYGFAGEDLPAETCRRFRTALARAGDWLVANDERHGFLSNHLAAAAAALCHAHRLLGDDRYERRSRHFRERILSRQSDEGWYEEYGGADPGYQTHGSFYLARLAELTRDQELLDSLDRACRFLAHCVHPDGSLGGEYASRNTQTYYPAAFEMLASRSGSARWIADRLRPSVRSLAAAGLGTVDIWNLFPLLNNHVFACRACLAERAELAAPEGPPAGDGNTWFPGAGILHARRPGYELWMGVHKGGVLKAFDRGSGRPIYNDSGYIGRLRNGRYVSTQWDDRSRPVTVGDSEIAMEGTLREIKKVVMRPFPFLGFRGFTLTLGRFRAASYWVKSLLVKVLVYRSRGLDLGFRRRVRLEDDGFTVTDEIGGPHGDRVASLRWSEVFTTIHMGSSRYFLPGELEECAARWREGGPEVDPGRLTEGVRLERTVRMS